MTIKRTIPLFASHLKERSRPRHEESDLQIACVRWFRLQYPQYTKLLFAVPNGGNRNLREAARMKAEGVTSGVADLILLMPRCGYTSLCIEMKKPGGYQSPVQKEWQQTAQNAGNRYMVCRRVEEFINIITNYLQK